MVDNPRNQYLQTQIMTASKEQLVLMLYDGFARFCENAKKSWAEDKLEDAHKALVKAQAIILELAFALDKQQGGKIAANLAQLYTYCYSRLVTANIERSVETIDEVQGIVSSLREAWGGAMGEMTSHEAATAPSVGISIPNPALKPHSPPSQTAPAISSARPDVTPKKVPLAKIPVARIPVPTPAQEQGSRLSVEG